MSRRLRKFLTFSNVVAVLALFFALGGTVYAAGQISGSQIKPKSIPANRIKSGSVTGKQIKAGSITGTQIKSGSLTGAKIKPGSITGTQIAGSTITGVNAAAIGAVQYVSVPVAIVAEAQGGSTGTAACPPGQKVIGGGATVNNPNYGFINESGPTADRNGWFANGYSGVAGVTMTVTAICTAVTSSVG